MKNIALLLLLLPLLPGCVSSEPSAPSNAVKSTYSGNPWRSFTDYDLETSAVAFSPDGKLLAAAGQNSITSTIKEKGRTVKLEGSDYTVRIWSTSTWKLARTLRFKELIGDIAFSRDGKLLGVSAGNTVTIYQTSDGKIVHTLGSQSDLSAIAFSPQGNVLSIGNKLIDTRTWKMLYNLPVADSTYSVAFAPDGKTLATGSLEGVVQAWDVQTGQLKKTIFRAVDFVDIVFSPDGKMLSSACWHDETVQLWSTSNWQQIGSPKGGATVNHGFGNEVFGVDSIAFSPDSKELVTASISEAGMKLWDITTGQVLHTLHGDNADLSAHKIVFSPDGNVIASASRSHRIDLWKVPVK